MLPGGLVIPREPELPGGAVRFPMQARPLLLARIVPSLAVAFALALPAVLSGQLAVDLRADPRFRATSDCERSIVRHLIVGRDMSVSIPDLAAAEIYRFSESGQTSSRCFHNPPRHPTPSGSRTAARVGRGLCFSTGAA